MDFFDTQAGYNFAAYTVPHLVQAIEEQNKILLEHTRVLRENTAMIKQYMALNEQKQPKASNKGLDTTFLV